MDRLNSTVWIVVLSLYTLMSVVAFVAMARDKRIAQRNARRLKAVRRVPERTLHLLEGFGGWLGSLLAQRTLRHKVQQRAYQVVFWVIVVVLLGLTWASALASIWRIRPVGNDALTGRRYSSYCCLYISMPSRMRWRFSCASRSGSVILLS